MTFNLETERLILRDILPSDANGMFELDSNPIVHKYLGNKPVKTIDESKKMIDTIIQQYEEKGSCLFLPQSTPDLKPTWQLNGRLYSSCLWVFKFQ